MDRTTSGGGALDSSVPSSATGGIPSSAAGGPAGPGRPGGAWQGRPAGRETDRQIAVGGVAGAAAFLALAIVAALLQGAGAAAVPGAPLGVAAWLPLHLALAGGATTAIAGVMPFFVGALAGAPPADARLRAASVLLVAAGALCVAVRGVAPSLGWVPVAGGVVFLAGIAAVASATHRAGRRGMLARRPVVSAAYALALGNVAVGASIGLLAVAGWVPVLEEWGTLKLAHAWANLLGFVSLVVVGTLLHFLPTVVAARIARRRSGVLAVVGLGVGVPAVVLGAVLVAVAGGAGAVASAAGTGGPILGIGDGLARLGALATIGGAIALAVETVAVMRSRAGWTTDTAWHRFSGGALVAAVGWFVVGTGAAALPVVVAGPAGAWVTARVIPALALGWVVQVLAGSWTHLVPAIGGGGPAGHAVRRRILAQGATARLVALNAGTALVAVGWPMGAGPLAGAGLVILLAGLGWSVLLVARALRAGRS